MSRHDRVVALDWLRGLVMVLMTIDHASGTFNAGRLMTDGFALYKPGTPLPVAQFMTRWITHLCAPTFVFLAGTALALSIEKRRRAGETARELDRFIVMRGLVIAMLDPLWMSPVFVPGRVLFQVLYAIGGGLVAMAVLRRLGSTALLAVAFVLLAGGEALANFALWLADGNPTLPSTLLVTGGGFGVLIVAYPLVPWLVIMLLGWWFGRRLAGRPGVVTPPRVAAVALAALAVFAVVRGLNGYGNQLLAREDGSLVQWLHVSKYPPALSYVTLELGLMGLVLAAFLAVSRRSGAVGWLEPLRVLGQTALFFYLLHVHVLTFAAHVLGLAHRSGLAATYVAALVTLVVLYPLCRWYGSYKRAHPDGWPRYV
jgi:uncharacterized membrane protein